MIEKSGYNQLTKLEQTEIDLAVEEDLLDNLFKSIIPANIVAFFASGAIFVFLYQPSNQFFLTVWLTIFDVTLLAIGALDYYYRTAKPTFSIQKWKFSYSILVLIFTMLWGSSIFFVPEPLFQRTLLYAMLFIAGASFAVATVGSVLLCLLCECFILFPLAAAFILQNSFYYTIGGIFVLFYILFLLGMNSKSTEWLKGSMKLSRILLSVSHSATHDLLTDLKNQRGLNTELENFIETASKTQESFALVCFSVNRLELFSTSLGYQTKDLIIQSLAKRLESRLARLNTQGDKIRRELTQPRSDTFVILISSVKQPALSKELYDYLKILEVPIHLGKQEATFTASIGVSIYPKDGVNSNDLLCNMYAAMFQAKNVGGNKIEFYEKKINEQLPSLLDLENDLHHALERKELLIYYQPIIDLRNQKISGMEALIRWKHPKRGIVYPTDFIHLAEETGLIIPIGKWVLEQACIQTASWNHNGFNQLELKVSVNLSAKQLREPGFLETIDHALRISRLPPRFLELEFTETELLDETLIPLIMEINKRGIALSIDDFGTGYSGLSYLKYFDIDKIKIDQSFIRDISNNNDSATIVSAILAMARELGIKTLAEGVETYDELKFLKEKDCNYIQGFYFSKPISTKEYGNYLKAHAHGISVDDIEISPIKKPKE